LGTCFESALRAFATSDLPADRLHAEDGVDGQAVVVEATEVGIVDQALPVELVGEPGRAVTRGGRRGDGVCWVAARDQGDGQDGRDERRTGTSGD